MWIKCVDTKGEPELEYGKLYRCNDFDFFDKHTTLKIVTDKPKGLVTDKYRFCYACPNDVRRYLDGCRSD